MGRKFTKKIKSGQAMLLHCLWRRHGGPVAVSRLCGVGMQQPNNWRQRGRVPLTHVRKVAAALKISVWSLNYAGMAQLHAKADRPTWESVVKSCNLSREETEAILFLHAPTIHF